MAGNRRAARQSESRNRRYSDNHKQNYYNHSSVAYDYALPDYEDFQYGHEAKPQGLPMPHEQVIIRKRRIGKSKPKYVKARNTRKTVSLTTYLTIGLFFVCAFICVSSISKNWEQQRNNTILTNELKSLKDRTSELVVEVSQSMDLAEIESIARKKLQMSEPEAHQIIEISVPRQNYTVYNQTDEIESLMASGSDKKLITLSGVKSIFSKD